VGEGVCRGEGPGLLFHDLRRSAVRKLVRAGVDRDVARKISGHKTEAMFARYNITDERDQ
jgi:integrase